MKTYDLMRPKGIYEEILLQREKDGVAFYDKYHKEFIAIPCPACGTEGTNAFKKYGFQHKVCGKCHTLFCSPRPNDALLTIYYNEYEAPKMWTSLLVAADTERKALQYKPRVEKVIAGIKKQGRNNGGIACDVGAGSGAFSIALKNTGFFSDIIALDLSGDCIKVCKNNGLNARVGSISDLNPESVDFICMNDLIEHLFNPALFLKECHRALRSGGFISIATPNGEGFDFKIMKERTKNITPPEHLNYFNVSSMGTILKSAGFNVCEIETPGMLDVDIILKEKQAGYPINDSNEYLNYLFGQDQRVLDNLQKFIVENKLSSHMLALAVK